MSNNFEDCDFMINASLLLSGRVRLIAKKLNLPAHLVFAVGMGLKLSANLKGYFKEEILENDMELVSCILDIDLEIINKIFEYCEVTNDEIL